MNRTSHTTAPLTVLALLTAGTALLAPAAAAAPVAAAASSPSPATPSCVVSLGFGPQPTTRCYAGLDAALAAATGGTLAAAPAGATAAVDPATLDARVEQANRTNAPTRAGTVIAIEYFDRDFQGYSWTVSTPADCTADVWQLDKLGDWNNQISSYRVFGQCQADHFDLRGYRGAHTGPLESRRFIGNKLNDRASAVRWT